MLRDPRFVVLAGLCASSVFSETVRFEFMENLKQTPRTPLVLAGKKKDLVKWIVKGPRRLSGTLIHV